MPPATPSAMSRQSPLGAGAQPREAAPSADGAVPAPPPSAPTPIASGAAPAPVASGAAATPVASGAAAAPVASTLAWRVIHDEARPGAMNMALDHALALELDGHEAVLRLYGWARPTVSFGRNEPARARYRPEVAWAGAELDYVRRPTGGRAVLHDDEVTYAVIAPPRALGGVRAAYRRVNEAIADALRSLGAAVTVSDAAGVSAIDAGPCFQSPAAGEVVASGRKLVGSAQARVGGALLQHGSIILSGDQSLLADRSERSEGSYPPPASLSSMVEGIGFDGVAGAVVERMSARLGGSWSEGAYRAREVEAAGRLVTERYGRGEWTWRR